MNILLAMIPAFFWGTTYAVAQLTLPDWPPLLLGALRALPAGLILLLINPSLPKKSQWGILFRLAMVNIAIFFSLIFVMASTLPSSISGVGMVSLPVFAMLYDWLINKNKPNKIQAFFGILLILLAWMLFNPGAIQLNPIGLIAMLLAVLCIVYGGSMTKLLGKRINWWNILTWQLILGGIILTIASLVDASLSPESYLKVVTEFKLINGLGLVWMILLNTVIAYALYVWLLQRMTVVDFTFAGIASPVTGILAGLLLLDESFTVIQYILMSSMILASLMPQIIEAMKPHLLANTQLQYE